jgi:hypothetical protein
MEETMSASKLCLTALFFAVWGGLLLYFYIMPGDVPDWMQGGGMRKFLFLLRDGHPSPFTLIMGSIFSALALFAAYRVATGKFDYR